MNQLLPLIMAAISILPAGLAVAKDFAISQKDKAFSTSEIKIAVGDRVMFKNDDNTAHNVFSSTDGGNFNLGVQKQGVESSHTFDSPGTVEVRCAIHPKMKLNVVVSK